MKKILFTFLIIVLFITVFVGGITLATNRSFSDVSVGDWFYTGVQYVSENNIMTGYSNGRFGPIDGVNRAQLATVLSRVDVALIKNFFTELNALRLYDLSKLKGSSWTKYKEERLRFPVNGIQGASEGMVSYEEVKNILSVLVTDDEGYYEILGKTGENFFFIKENSELFNFPVYGPFYDDVARIVSEAGIR